MNIGMATKTIRKLREDANNRRILQSDRTRAEQDRVIDELIDIVQLLLEECTPVIIGSIASAAFLKKDK